MLTPRYALVKGLNTPARTFASQTATKSHDLHSSSKPQVKQTKLPNGLPIIALQNNSPISRVGILVRAGARFEGPDQLGVSHAMRSAIGLATRASTAFGVTRNIDYHGGSLTASSTREDLMVLLEIQRDNLSKVIKYLGHAVTQPAFKPWELTDNVHRMRVDRKRMKQTAEVRLLEIAHEAAFKFPLCNSLFSPKNMIGKHDHNMMMDYFNTHFVTSRMAVVGLGVDLSMLTEAVEKSFAFNSAPAPEIPKGKFTPGRVTLESGGNVAYAAIVAEGASAKNSKDVLALSLFQQALGTSPRIKYSDGASYPLGSAAAVATQYPFALTGINISYSDTGLFGVAIGAAASDVHGVIKSVVKKMREVGKGLTDTQLKNGKQQLKAHVLQCLEHQNQVFEELGTRALNGDSNMSLDNVESTIDALSANDVNEAVSRVLKGKVAIAGLGKVNNIPYIEDLI